MIEMIELIEMIEAIQTFQMTWNWNDIIDNNNSQERKISFGWMTSHPPKWIHAPRRRHLPATLVPKEHSTTRKDHTPETTEQNFDLIWQQQRNFKGDVVVDIINLKEKKKE